MKPKTISYSESKESVDSIGLKSWRKAGVEIELEDGVVEAAFEEAKKIVNDALGNGYNKFVGTSLATTGIYPNSQSPLPEIDQKKQDILDLLNDPTTIAKDLEDGKLITSIIKHGLVKEYNEKKKQLQ